jgi:hypothetical protein
MQNYSSVFAETLAEFVSPIVPGDQGDAGKGQVTARAVHKINRTLNANVGYIAKNPGQTQYFGISVAACSDKSDGTGADYLTDVDLGNGTREIRLMYSAYAPPPPGSPLPPADWRYPTDDMLTKGGPLTLKSETPVPGPEPEPGPDEDAARFDALDASVAALSEQVTTSTAEILARSDANTEAIQTQIHDLVEDAEESLKEIGLVLLFLLRRDPAARSASATSAETASRLDRFLAGVEERRARRVAARA